jgi:maltose alpha-D-glucosyltransferase/alpha-amylase
MLRSFHYAVCAKLYFSSEASRLPGDVIESAAEEWYEVVSQVYLKYYFSEFGESSIIGNDKGEQSFLLKTHLLEKAVYELGYELNGRPSWVKIPLKGIEQVIGEIQETSLGHLP